MASCEEAAAAAPAPGLAAAAAAAAGSPCAGKAAAAAAGSVPWWRPCANPGNPVFSCMLDAQALPSRPPLSQKPPPQPLLFRTTSRDYGAVPPTSPMVPCRHCPRENAFTNHLFACGLTQFNGINTGLDRDRPCDPAELLNGL